MLGNALTFASSTSITRTTALGAGLVLRRPRCWQAGLECRHGVARSRRKMVTLDLPSTRVNVWDYWRPLRWRDMYAG